MKKEKIFKLTKKRTSKNYRFFTQPTYFPKDFEKTISFLLKKKTILLNEHVK